MNIQGHAAIVTGGASGLGEASARELTTAGGKVAIFDLNVERGKQVAEEIGGVFAEVDITDEASVQAGITLATAKHGPARILVNCAAISGPGIRTAGRKGPYPLEVFRKLVEVNLIGAFNVTRLAANEMLGLETLERKERGVIINVASINALDGPVGTVGYTAAKAGVVGMTITIARDLAPKGIRVCTIAPGNFATPMLMSAPSEFLDDLLPKVPFPNDSFGDPADFARLARHICENVMLNGEVIRLDGAIRMAPK
jgi:NAD(P)-dependent dehydrogenase (short-subunit alcohol dehydrogenase family)